MFTKKERKGNYCNICSIKCSNKKAFHWDAYCPLVDRAGVSSGFGGFCLGLRRVLSGPEKGSVWVWGRGVLSGFRRSFIWVQGVSTGSGELNSSRVIFVTQRIRWHLQLCIVQLLFFLCCHHNCLRLDHFTGFHLAFDRVFFPIDTKLKIFFLGLGGFYLGSREEFYLGPGDFWVWGILSGSGEAPSRSGGSFQVRGFNRRGGAIQLHAWGFCLGPGGSV